MAALKKISIALALALMVSLLGVEGAKAQSIPPKPLSVVNCTAFSIPTEVRAEGLAEAFGEFRMDCINTGVFNPLTTPQEDQNFIQYITTNIDLELLNTNVTNATNVGTAGFTGAVMVINENNAFNPLDSSQIEDLAGQSCDAPDTRFPCPHKGQLVGSNRLVWEGVQVPIPGAPNGDGAGSALPLPADGADGIPNCISDGDDGSNSCFPFTTTIRITNVRGNATVFGLGDSLPDLTARLSITGPVSISIDDNVKTLAIPRVGLISDIIGSGTGLQCIGGNEDVSINLKEGFAASFKTLGAPTFQTSGRIAENGYPLLTANSFGASVQSNGGTGGGATQATRFMIRFFNVQDGVSILVPRHVNNAPGEAGTCEDPGNVDGDALCLSLVTGTDSNGEGGSASGSTGFEEVAVSGGVGFAVYEVKDGNPFSLENINIPVNFDFPFDPDEPDLPAVGVMTADVTFAPLCTTAANCPVATNARPRPRFIDSGGDPDSVLTIVRCTTTLLFPFVTQVGTFDTGIAISNTSFDWLGTPPQEGACTVHFIGTKDGEEFMDDATSDVIPAGGQLIFLLSAGSGDGLIPPMLGFQGFVVAQCEFQYAHGFAFVSDGFTAIPNGFQGYLALVIPLGEDGNRHPGEWHLNSSDNLVNDGLGERLGQ